MTPVHDAIESLPTPEELARQLRETVRRAELLRALLWLARRRQPEQDAGGRREVQRVR